MSIEHTHVAQWARGNENRSGRRAITVDAEKNFEVSVPGGTTDMQVNINIDVSMLKSLFLKTTNEDITLKTNDTVTPGNTLTLKADQGENWHDELNAACPLTVDVTTVYLTNAGTKAATVSLFACVDATP